MGKLITAEFGSVDMAELAARNIKHKFEGISKIKIKYRNLDSGIRQDGYMILPSASAINGSLGMSYVGAYRATLDQEEYNETCDNISSVLEVGVSEAASARVANYLRGLGGLGIHIQQDRE